RGMNWYIENRTITASSGANLTLNEGIECEQNPNADCSGWGYFINNALPAVDIEGEWCYDKPTSTIYLYSSNGVPPSTEIEGSVVLKDDERYWGGITLGTDLGAEISYVNICNLDIRNWYCNGIAIPTNLEKTEICYVTIKNCFISDVDGSGVNLVTWVYNAMDGGNSGWRGGSHLQILDNTITRANRFGINCYSVYSKISGNRITRIGLLENVGWSGLGCSVTDNGGMCTEDGSGIRIKVSDQPKEAGCYDTISNNFIDSVGYCGMDIFGQNNLISKNIIRSALSSKQDGGGIRVFGDNAKSITIDSNTIIDAIGNWYGTAPEFNKPFGFGLYIDENAASVNCTGNTIFNSSAGAILYQNASGNCVANIMYTNSKACSSAQKLNISETSNVTQNDNITGFDSTSEIFFNDSWVEKTVNLENKPYLNLQGELVQGSIALSPFTSVILLQGIAVNSWKPLTCKTDADRISIVQCHGDVIFRGGKNCTGVDVYLLNGTRTAATILRNGIGDWKTRKMSKGVYIAKFKLKGHPEIRKFWVF
ncbi:MAG TPA: right-handed parallel beta-helix repeat-containing protein, partial [Chitinispirillaceae bacterium]|nr:right-handed parallel beta-helix repeat-containing protein [Chitinispirillaceae bacterium]